MPQIPRHHAREGVPALRLPRPGTGQFGGEQFEALGQLAETYRKTEEVSDAMASTELARKANRAMKNEIERTRREYSDDPEVFESYAASRAEEAKKLVLGEAKSDRIKNLAEFKLGDELERAQGEVRAYRAKMETDNALATLERTEDELSTELASERDPKVFTNQMVKYKADLLILQKNGAIKPQEAAKREIEFRKKLAGKKTALDASTDPYGFQERVERGDYKGVADDFQIERGMNIAEKTINITNQRETKANKARSERIEDAMIKRAEQHTLDPALLDETAAFYEWDKTKVDKIKRLNSGIRVSTVDDEKRLVDAMDSVNKPAPTMADLKTAEDRLLAMPEMADTPQYRAEMARIRTLRRSLQSGGRGDAGVRSDARRRVSQLANIYLAGQDTTKVKPKVGEWMRQVDTMPAQQIPQFLKEIEKELQDSRKARSERRQIYEGMRSVIK